MRRNWIGVIAVVVLLLFSVQTVAAAPAGAGGGPGVEGVHFGSYDLESGARAVGDLVVFGGPVRLREGSEFDGDLTVFGPMTLERDGLLDGQLVVMGTADLAGRVRGDVFAAGEITLRDTARVEGDLSATGQINRSAEAVVTGDIQSVDEAEWPVPGPVTPPFFNPEVVRPSRMGGASRWMTFLWRVVRGIVSVILMGLLALLIASLWPAHTERVGRIIEEAPLTSYGIGLLTLLLAGIVALLLTITICLSPFALIGMIIVALGVLLGWVALGLILGRRILAGVLNTATPSPVGAAVVGTVLITLIVALARVLGPVHTLLLFLLGPLAAGAVVLTRFGTRPYATRGVSRPAVPYTPPPSSRSPGSSQTPAPPPLSPAPHSVERELPMRVYPEEELDEAGPLEVEGDEDEDELFA